MTYTYEARNRSNLTLSATYYMPIEGKYYRCSWLGTCGYFDHIPIERWIWHTGPRKGQTQESYSAIFYRRDDSRGNTAGYDNATLYHVEYLCPWGWESWGRYFGTVVAAKIRTAKRQFSIQYEWRATPELHS